METRDIKQAKIFTLHTNIDVLVGKKGGEETRRTDRVAVAIFDDAKKLEAYKSKAEKPKDFLSYEVVEDWVEFTPAADKFGLPFNPAVKPLKSVAKGKDDTNANGTD